MHINFLSLLNGIKDVLTLNQYVAILLGFSRQAYLFTKSVLLYKGKTFVGNIEYLTMFYIIVVGWNLYPFIVSRFFFRVFYPLC